MTDKFTNDAHQQLRDARLAKALQHAPDADALPSPAIRDTIKTIAFGALEISAKGRLHAKTPWWKTLWVSTGSTRGPWGGALATLVLGCIITALWYGQEVPDEKVRYSGEAAKVVSADASAPTPSPAPARMQERAATTAPLAKSAAQETIPAAKMKAPVRSEEATAPAAPAVLADKATGNGAPMATPAAAAAPAPTPAPAPATAATASAPAPVASGLVASLRKSRTASTEWHSASVQYQGHTKQLAAADAKLLDVYVRAVVNSATPLASGENPTAAAPVLRIVFAETDANTNGTQAVFTLWPSAMQWQRAGQPDVLGVPQADALAALLAHVRSLPK